MDRAIIFDVDGTLAETEEGHRRAFNRAFADAGLPWRWDRDLYRKLLAVTGGKERIRYFIEDFEPEEVPGGDRDEFVGALHANKTRAYTQIVEGGDIELRPGVRQLIAVAREKGYRLAIATTTTPANIDALLLATLGKPARELFEAIGAGDSVPAKKPAPDVYLQVLEQLGVSPGQCIAIEDSRNGLLAAHAAGIATIVTPGVYTDDENFDEATLVVEDLASLEFSSIESLFG